MFEDFSNLVDGDDVIISQCFGHPDVIGKVKRTTKTQIFITCKPFMSVHGERRFQKDGGREIPYRRDGLRIRNKKESTNGTN